MARILRNGDQGAEVRAVQDALNFHIRRLQPLAVDGIFGAKTQARVIEFQRANGLTADGAVGPLSAGKLFETESLTLTLQISPRLQLTLPGGARAGIQPPRLIPQLVLPGPPVVLRLPPASLARLPALTQQGQLLTLSLDVPSRNDPLDPTQRSFNQVVQLLQTLPANFPFRADIVGLVPNPVKKPGGFGFGFSWGVDPLFDLGKLGPPIEFTVGLKANARYALGLVNRGPGGLKIGLFAKGDFKGELDYTSERAISRPLLKLDGTILVGLGGVF